ncbi:MAG: hypothetical protein QM640_00535 [Niabella sp.]
MARTAAVESIESQINHYISGLSNKNKQAVLTVVKTIAEAEREVEFERKWVEGMPLEEARQELLKHVRGFEWKQKK